MAALILAVAAGTVVSVTVEPDGASHRDIASQFASLLLAAGPGASQWPVAGIAARDSVRVWVTRCCS